MDLLKEPPIAYALYLGNGTVIKEILPEDVRFLRNMLLSSKSDDAYVRSPLYFAFTGRKGLWHLHIGGTEVIACIHPNDSRTVLLFIPFLYDESSFKKFVDDIGSILRNGTNSPLFKFFADFDNVHIARVPKTLLGFDTVNWCSLGTGFEVSREKKLDWIFPSYDVLLERSSAPKGPELASYRNKLNKFKDRGVVAVPFGDLQASERAAVIRRLSQRWAKNKMAGEKSGCGPVFSEHELREPYEHLADLALNPGFSIDGIFLKRDDEFIAFRLWEYNGSRDNAVPSFAALYVSHEPGCCEYLHYKAAQRLLELGYKEMCIGGSESEGLDAFKQKFCPVRRHELYTVELDIYQIANLTRPHHITALAA